MIKLLIIFYIIIVILQFIITKYSLPDESKDKIDLNNKIKYNLEHKDELLSIFSKKILDIANKINSHEMDFDEWVVYFNSLPPTIIKEHKYYFSLFEHLNGKTHNEHIIHHYGNPKYIGFTFTEIKSEMDEMVINSKYAISSELNNNVFGNAKIGYINKISYFWIDPLSLQSVKKHGVNTKWKDKNGREGYINMGIDIEDLSQSSSYKYYTNIDNITLFLTSIITLIIAIIINNLDYTKKSKFKAFLFLIISNIYILLYINSYENENTPENELLKLNRITSSILSLSVLSGVNIYILKILLENKNLIFQETALIYGVSVILILMTIYKYKNPDEITNLITQRITSQYTFNLAVLLNGIILFNYMYYILSIKNIIKIS